MSTMLRAMLVGFVSLVSIAAGDPLHAQTTQDPIFFCGVVGDAPSTRLRTVQGDSLTFVDPRPTEASIDQLTAVSGYGGGGSLQGGNVTSCYLVIGQTPTESGFWSSTLDYRAADGTTATGEGYVVIFPTAESRDAFLYYSQQRDAAATVLDYHYFNAFAYYEFWMGQGNTGTALYCYYTAMADYEYGLNVDMNLQQLAEGYYLSYRGLGAYYYFDWIGDLESADISLYSYYTGLADYDYAINVDADPQLADYYYWYDRGLGAYYYFKGIGDLESAYLSWAYYYQLAVEALEPSPEKKAPPKEKIPEDPKEKVPAE